MIKKAKLGVVITFAAVGALTLFSAGTSEGMKFNPLTVAWGPDGCSDYSKCTNQEQHYMHTGTRYMLDMHQCNTPADHSGPGCQSALFTPKEVMKADPARLAEMMSRKEPTSSSTKQETLFKS